MVVIVIYRLDALQVIGARAVRGVARGRFAQAAHAVRTTSARVRHQAQRTSVPVADGTPDRGTSVARTLRRCRIGVGWTSSSVATAASGGGQRHGQDERATKTEQRE